MAGPRSQARRYAVLALYQWHVTGDTPAHIARQFYDDPLWLAALAAELTVPASAAPVELPPAADEPLAAHKTFDVQLFDQLLHEVPTHIEAIETALQPVLDRSLKSIDPVERVILNIGVYELLFSPQLPPAVVINEAIELTKMFGAEQGHRYINGVLDRVAKGMHR